VRVHGAVNAAESAAGGVGVSVEDDDGVAFEGFFHDEHESLFAALWLVTRNRHEAEEIMRTPSSGSGSGGTVSPAWRTRSAICIEPA
jgi:hypothetical protein